MIAIARHRIDHGEVTLCREWNGVRDTVALAASLAAEHMRALIYGAAASDCPAGTIHSAKLLASARKAVGLLWPQFTFRSTEQVDICAIALNHMKAIGDAADTGYGHWLATPLRIVAPNNSPRCLLVGTAPFEAARRRLGARPNCAGISRFVGAAEIVEQEYQDIVLSVDSWLGYEPPLVPWTVQLISHHIAHMEAVDGLSAEQFEIYAPDVLQAQRRGGRWIPSGQVGRPLDGIRLCRPQARFAKNWDRPSYLAQFGFKRGVLTIRRAARISDELTLRLRFGLDAMLRMPRRVLFDRQRETFWIKRPPYLPEPERRIYALGWKIDTQDNSDRIAFHIDAMPFVAHGFQRLGIAPTITNGGEA